MTTHIKLPTLVNTGKLQEAMTSTSPNKIRAQSSRNQNLKLLSTANNQADVNYYSYRRELTYVC